MRNTLSAFTAALLILFVASFLIVSLTAGDRVMLWHINVNLALL